MLGVALQSVAMPHSLAMPLLPDTLANASAEGSVYADDQQVQAYSDNLRAFKECAPAPWVDLNGTSAAEYGRLFNPTFPNLDNLEYPHVPVSACVGGAWTITRAGPVITRGNAEDWMVFVVNPTEVQRPNAWAIDAYIIGRADEHGDFIPNPPLRLQDRHLGVATSMPAFQAAFPGAGEPISKVVEGNLDNHVDSQCASANGGTACLTHVAPPGFAWFFSGHLALLAKTFDMRPNHSQPLHSWETVALRVTRATSRPVYRQFMLGAGQFVLMVNRGVESVFWNSGTSNLPSASLVGTPSWHTHGKDVTQAWFFQGTAAHVFEELAAVLPAYKTPWYGAAAVAKVQESIRARAALAGAAPLVCSYTAEDLYPNKENSSLGIVWRHTPCPLQPPLWHWVMVVFVNPPSMLPAETCPAGTRGCSPVIVEAVPGKVALHAFVRANLGVVGDKAVAATGMAEFCTPGTSCRPSFLGYSPAATCANHTADCTYPACDGDSCAECKDWGCTMPDVLFGTTGTFSEPFVY